MKYTLILFLMAEILILVVFAIYIKRIQKLKLQKEEDLPPPPIPDQHQEGAEDAPVPAEPSDEEGYVPVYENFVEGNIINLLSRAIVGVAKTQSPTVSVIEEALGRRNIYRQASKYLDCMLDVGIVVENEYHTRKVAITEGQARQIIIPQMQDYPEQWGMSKVLEQLRKDVAFMLSDFWTGVDTMTGIEFEEWCMGLLEKLGFEKVESTSATGDQGVDILAVKDEVPYAFQCKCYAKDLGNSPVQEVYAGLRYYHRNVGVVITNRHFTQGARDLANATDVLLWDRDKLKKLIQAAGLVV